MRILITGGAGYIGTILVAMLLERGHHVTVLDTFKSGGPDLSSAASTIVRAIKGDAATRASSTTSYPKHDVLIPLAAWFGAPLCKEDAIGATTLKPRCRDRPGPARGRRAEDRLPNDQFGLGVGEAGKFCTEESPLRPISLYGTTKVEAETAVLDRGRGVSLRLATVFGMAPRMRLDLLVNDFTHRAVTDRALLVFEGHFKRNYIPHPRRGQRLHPRDRQLRPDARRGVQSRLSSANLS